MIFKNIIQILTYIAFIHASSFDSNGRLIQLEYAYKAASNAKQDKTFVGATNHDTSILVSYRTRGTISLTSKVHKLTRWSAIGVSGIVSDGTHILNKITEELIDYRAKFEADPPIQRLLSTISDYLYDKTCNSYSRPLGVNVCCICYDESNKAQVIEMDPMGDRKESEFVCIGSRSSDYYDKWMEIISPDYQSSEGSNQSKNIILIKNICKLFKELHDDKSINFEVDRIEMFLVGENLPFCQLNNNIIHQLFQNNNYDNFDEIINQIKNEAKDL
eukprot:gene5177-7204_t